MSFLRKHKENINFILFAVMMSCISFNYFIFKGEKDGILIGIHQNGAEVITFIKIFLIIPCSILASKAYPKILKKVSPSKALFISMLPMTIYLPIFNIILPMMENQNVTWINQFVPQGWSGLAIMINRWDTSIFYILGELWGSIVLQVVFWGMLNDITSLDKAKNFYGKILVTSSFAGIISGFWSIIVYSLQSDSMSAKELWYYKIKINLSAALAINIIAIAVFFIIEKLNGSEVFKTIPKENFTNIETFQKCFKNRIIFFLSMSVICMGVITTSSEILWKSMIKERFPDPSCSSAYLNKISLASNILGIFLGLFFKQLMDKLGWLNTSNAMSLAISIPAIIMLFMRSINVFYNHDFILEFAMFTGSIQSIIARAMKTTIYDGTKDFALIPLTRALKASGKAIIDGLTSRAGKVISSIFFIVSLLFFKEISSVCIPVMIMVIAATLFWIFSIKNVHEEILLQDETNKVD